MIDFSFIGKEGLIIQYEDIISLMGFNVVCYLREQKAFEKINKMSTADILLSYINRSTEDISSWLKKEFDIDFDIKNYIDSFAMLRPNLLYSYKIFSSAYKNGIKKLGIHSNYYSKAIEQAIQTYQIPIEYTYGDIIPVLNNRPNITYTTASTANIIKCSDIEVPIAITIVDDFMYTADVLINKIDDKLRNNGKFVCFTSVLSAGMI